MFASESTFPQVASALTELYYSFMYKNGHYDDGEPAVFAFLRAARVLEDRLEEAMGRVGLSGARYGVLDQLARARDPLALGELAERLSCVRSNITQLVDRLEADGLVRRVSDPDDRRSIRAELTEAGLERTSQGAEQLRALGARFESVVPRAECERLLRATGGL